MFGSHILTNVRVEIKQIITAVLVHDRRVSPWVYCWRHALATRGTPDVDSDVIPCVRLTRAFTNATRQASVCAGAQPWTLVSGFAWEFATTECARRRR